jgi:2-oxoglutarate/2-oxoacid ferredoxin oxidoreductase subunit alpha
MAVTLSKPSIELANAVIGFAGDSGDGMQLVGTEFANTSANLGNDISTFPDFPAEIRAPAGTIAGVSGFQLQFSSDDIYTPGDRLSALVAMNPAALKLRLRDLELGGILIVNSDSFAGPDLRKAGYPVNPLEDGSLSGYRVISIPMTKTNRQAVAECGLTPRESDRCKNFFALGIVYWLFERNLETTERWIRQKFGKKPAIEKANLLALHAGHAYGETCELLPAHFHVARAHLPPGTYRKITGNQALAMGLVTATARMNKPLVYAGYPITPASDILHHLCELRNFGVYTIQAEDEIAAVGMAIGASFAGRVGVTATSGPGICLKAEGVSLAVMTELPLVVIDVQRGGPSTGLPTKTEQADLLQALYGRHGECPVAVLAPRSPGDCFAMAMEAVRIAVRFMTPVFLLSDGYLANSSEPWRIPDVDELPRIDVRHPTGPNIGSNGDAHFAPYLRDDRLVRPWAIPGTPGLEHRLGGLEKADVTGDINYEPANHEHMVRTRAQKIANIAAEIPPLEVTGPDDAELLVLGWGGTYGSILTAVERCRRQGMKVAQAHLRYLNPMPANTGDVVTRFRKVLIPELNSGQLCHELRARYLIDAISLAKIQGQPFLTSEIESRIASMLT